MESEAKWDWFTKVVTLFLLSFYGVLIFKFIRGSYEPEASEPVIIKLLILLTVVIVIVYLFSVKKYRITNDSLEIVRVLNVKSISLSSLKEVRVVSNSEMAWTIRLFGSGGLFGFIGYFWNYKHRFISAYATRMTRLVLVTTKENKKMIISPEDFEFVEMLQQKIHLEE
jgi:hypothetical protein